MRIFYLPLTLVLWATSTKGATQPHIVFILADDLGWNDVSYHGSNQIPTPNIDALAYTGAIFRQYYSEPICTPSRSALLTGKEPYNIGMQHNVLEASEPRGLPLNHTLLPEYLKQLNYKTHIVGKWDVGHYKREYTPTYRGFDSHVGIWSGHHDQFDHTAFEAKSDSFNTDFEFSTTSSLKGLDMRRNMDIAPDLQGVYSTHVFTNESVSIIMNHDRNEPLFLYLAQVAVHSGNPYNQYPAPDETVANFSYIKDWRRQRFAAMAAELDFSVGQVVKALGDANMLDNCIIVFASDNGAPLEGAPDENYGSNWPLKGNKYTLFEGGTRVPALLWYSQLKNPGRVSQQLLHITDWLPTLVTAAGGDSQTLADVDGIDQWDVLVNDLPSKRNQIVYNIDGPIAAIRVNEWKYITGAPFLGLLDPYSGQSGKENILSSYSSDLIIQSPAYQAVSTARTTKLSAVKILALRAQAQIYCQGADFVPNAKRTSSCDPLVKPCLFNVVDDPCETTDVSSQHPDIVEQLRQALDKANSTAIPPGNLPNDPRANPMYWNWTWTNFGDYLSDL